VSALVLDASALLALLLGEPGGEKVRAVLADSVIASVNIAEVVGHFARNGAAEPDIRRVLDPLPFECVAFDAELAYFAGLLVPATRRLGLSLGDRACLALARRNGAPALTADRSWQSLSAAIGVEIDVLR